MSVKKFGSTLIAFLLVANLVMADGFGGTFSHNSAPGVFGTPPTLNNVVSTVVGSPTYTPAPLPSLECNGNCFNMVGFAESFEVDNDQVSSVYKHSALWHASGVTINSIVSPTYLEQTLQKLVQIFKFESSPNQFAISIKPTTPSGPALFNQQFALNPAALGGVTCNVDVVGVFGASSIAHGVVNLNSCSDNTERTCIIGINLAANNVNYQRCFTYGLNSKFQANSAASLGNQLVIAGYAEIVGTDSIDGILIGFTNGFPTSGELADGSGILSNEEYGSVAMSAVNIVSALTYADNVGNPAVSIDKYPNPIAGAPLPIPVNAALVGGVFMIQRMEIDPSTQRAVYAGTANGFPHFVDVDLSLNTVNWEKIGTVLGKGVAAFPDNGNSVLVSSTDKTQIYRVSGAGIITASTQFLGVAGDAVISAAASNIFTCAPDRWSKSSLTTLDSQDIILTAPQGLPSGCTIEPSFSGGGYPIVYWQNNFLSVVTMEFSPSASVPEFSLSTLLLAVLLAGCLLFVVRRRQNP